jgi:hypothetical protein
VAFDPLRGVGTPLKENVREQPSCDQHRRQNDQAVHERTVGEIGEAAGEKNGQAKGNDYVEPTEKSGGVAEKGFC